jgi:hypothetical protein
MIPVHSLLFQTNLEVVAESQPSSFLKTVSLAPTSQAGGVVDGANVDVFLLTETGAKPMAAVASYQQGNLITLSLPLKAIQGATSRGHQVYASANVLFAETAGSLYGQWAVPIDPTDPSILTTVENVAFPMTDAKSNTVMATRAPVRPANYVIDTTWAYTEVLYYAVGTNITAKWDYPAGCKVRVESKWSQGSGWFSGGSTEVTIENLLHP